MEQLIDSRGIFKLLNGYIVDACFSNNENSLAFASSDGDMWIVNSREFRNDKSWHHFNLLSGGILSLSQGYDEEDFLVSSDSNQIIRTKLGSGPQLIKKTKSWVERVITWYDEAINSYLIAISEKKNIYIYVNNLDEPQYILDHSYTVSDFIVSKDKKLLVTSHYNGVTLWEIKANSITKLKELEWKGSHLSVVIHPTKEAIVTSMQDCDLHGWRLSDYHHMRMSGYTNKVKFFCFSSQGKWLATSGTESVVLWPFFDGGPMGKAPKELPGLPGQQCCAVQFHPQMDNVLVAGFSDGTILLYSVDEEKVLPVIIGNEKEIGMISCLKFNTRGSLLFFGTEKGYVGILDLS